MVVIKRNGAEKPYRSRKVRLAIAKANRSLSKEEQATEEQIDFICNRIESCDKDKIHVEEIQDIIENQLMAFGLHNLAKNYIIYRYNRMLARRANTTDSSILSLVRGSNEDVIRENSNKDAYAASTQRDLIAGEVSKDLTWRVLLPQDIVEAHQNGVLHFHDADYFLQPIPNCCLINIKDMLDNGTVINGLFMKPTSFKVACKIMSQVIETVASNQYGGQSVNIKHLGKYIAMSREKIKQRTKARWLKQGIAFTQEQLDCEVEEVLKKEVEDGVQSLQYELNSHQCATGQTPFITLFLHIDDKDPYVEDIAMLVEEIIKQRIQGVLNKQGVYVTPAFPKLVYVLDENNCLRGGKYDYITKLCAVCNTKRIYPDYISAKVMREIHEGEVYSPMGCVDGKEVIQYKYNDNLYTESFERMWRRLSDEFPTKLQHPDHKDMYMDVKGVSIWDNNLGEFTDVYRVIRNVSDSWLNLKFSNGRSLRVTRDHPFETRNRGVVLAENLTESDQILVDKGFSVEGNEDLITPEEAWFTGVCLCDSSYSSVLNISLGDDEEDIQNKLTEIAEKNFALEMYKFHHDRGDKGIYTDLRARGNGNTSISIRRDLEDIFEGIKKVDRHIPNTIFSCSYDVRLAFLCGMIDADGHIKYNNRLSTVELGSTNKELALQEMLLAQSLGFKARVYQNHYCSSDRDKIRFRVEFDASSELLKYLVSGKKRDRVDDTCRVNSSNFTDDYCTLTEREDLSYTDFSYDVTTASEHFSVSGLYSHNCRSFLGEWQNENGDYVWEGRFNQGRLCPLFA